MLSPLQKPQNIHHTERHNAGPAGHIGKGAHALCGFANVLRVNHHVDNAQQQEEPEQQVEPPAGDANHHAYKR